MSQALKLTAIVNTIQAKAKGLPFDLSTVAAPIADAASAEHLTREKWVKAGKAAYKAGVRVAMLVKPTEKAPNPQYDEPVFKAIRSFIISGMSASKKPQKFAATKPGAVGQDAHTWSIADMLALSTDDLRSIDDDTLKAVRREKMMLVDGPMMSRVKLYIDREENPDKARQVKAAKNDKAAAVATDNSIAGYVLALDNMMAHRTVLKLSAADADAFGNAVAEALVVLRRAAKKMEAPM